MLYLSRYIQHIYTNKQNFFIFSLLIVCLLFIVLFSKILIKLKKHSTNLLTVVLMSEYLFIYFVTYYYFNKKVFNTPSILVTLLSFPAKEEEGRRKCFI